VTARSRERGIHAGRPRHYTLPFPDHHGLGPQAPARPGSDPTGSGPTASGPTASGPTGSGPTASGPTGSDTPGSDTPARDTPGGGLPRGGARRHRRPPEPKSRLSGKHKLAGVLAVVVILLGVGFADGFGDETSAEPTVQAFLLDWQQGNYAQAAALTNGDNRHVTAQLAAAYTDLDATNAFFAVGPVQQHGDTAVAAYKVTVDLAQPGQQWVYTSQFKLTEQGGHWVVDWGLSVINPSLATGDRLAVVDAFPPRAQVENANGGSLMTQSTVYLVGVYPGRLANAATTAAAFSRLTGLSRQQVLGQIQAAPPRTFLSLLTLEPDAYSSLWPKVAKVPGIRHERRTERLFGSLVPEAVGEVGTEDSDELRAEGAAYQPGTTVGLTGLEQTYTDELAGTPTTSVVVVNSAGRTVATLWNSPGQAGTPVHTTLSSQDQTAARTALAAQPGSGEIVAVNTQTGAIRALASHKSGTLSLPSGGALNSKVAPGMAFSIVSAAALLSAGVPEDQPLPCEPVANGAGVAFAYQPTTSASATFASDFVAGCGTAFAAMAKTLSPGELKAAEHAFGIGGSWHLHVPAFSGSASVISGEADLAAEATGQSGVLTSPLSMAMVAAEVASGVGRPPFLVGNDQSATWQVPLSTTGLSELRELMRLAVAKGSAHAADVSGAPVYGQAGVIKTGKNAYLSWFVGYRGGLAVAAIETSTTASQAAAAALAGAFLKVAR
jgi:cell division protein FtsI/penicillin-binding protein 2